MDIEQFIQQLPDERMEALVLRAELTALKETVKLPPTLIEDTAKIFNLLIEREYEKTTNAPAITRPFGFAIPRKDG